MMNKNWSILLPLSGSKMTDTNSGDTQNNTTTESVNNMRSRLSDLRKTFDSYVTLQKQEKEDLRQQNEILKQKKDTLVKVLAEHYRRVQECGNSECNYMVINFDGVTSDNESHLCHLCEKNFCLKHFDSHDCQSYGCSGV